MKSKLRACSTINRIARRGLTFREAPSDDDLYVRSKSSGHCSSSTVTVPVKLGPHFNLCEGCDFDNKPMDLPFQSQNVIKFVISLRFPFRFALRNVFILPFYICILLLISFLVMNFNSCCRKSFVLVQLS